VRTGRRSGRTRTPEKQIEKQHKGGVEEFVAIPLDGEETAPFSYPYPHGEKEVLEVQGAYEAEAARGFKKSQVRRF